MRLPSLSLVIIATLVLGGCHSAPQGLSEKPVALPDSESIRGRKAQEADQVSAPHPAAGRPRPAKWTKVAEPKSLSITDPDSAEPLSAQLETEPLTKSVGNSTTYLSRQSPAELTEFYQRQNPRTRVTAGPKSTVITIPVEEGRLVVTLSPSKDGRTLAMRQLITRQRAKEIFRTATKSSDKGAK